MGQPRLVPTPLMGLVWLTLLSAHGVKPTGTSCTRCLNRQHAYAPPSSEADWRIHFAVSSKTFFTFLFLTRARTRYDRGYRKPYTHSTAHNTTCVGTVILTISEALIVAWRKRSGTLQASHSSFGRLTLVMSNETPATIYFPFPMPTVPLLWNISHSHSRRHSNLARSP